MIRERRVDKGMGGMGPSIEIFGKETGYSLMETP